MLLGILLVFSFVMVPQYGIAQSSLLWRDLFSVSFPSETLGWACGRRGIIANSKDGGETWTRQISGTSYTLMSMVFIDGKTGWAVGDAGTILHTQDGGNTWVAQKSPVDSYLMAVHFADASNGWIATEETTILATRDGGKTWAVQFKDRNEDVVLRSISFCDARNGWAGGENGFIYHTGNGGETWEKQAGFVEISEETELLVSGNFIFDVQAVDPTTAWVVGLGKYVAKTTDGGQTWEKLELDLIPEVHLFAVRVDSVGNTYIGGNGVLVRSEDGGKTFKHASVSPAVTYGWIGDIAQRGGNGLVAVGNKAWVYRNSNPPSGDWKLALYKK